MSPQTGAVSGLRPVSLGAVNWAVFPGTQAIRTRHLHPDLRRAPWSLSWCETPVPAVTAQKAGRTAPAHAPSRGSAQRLHSVTHGRKHADPPAKGESLCGHTGI